jgi:hypothetical protein
VLRRLILACFNIALILFIDIIKNLRGVSFEYTPESEMGDGIRYGFIAQEVQRFILEIV